MDFIQTHTVKNSENLSFEEVKGIIKSLPNPTGAKNRYYDDGILGCSNILRRNQKGASQHTIQIVNVVDDKVELLFKLADFKPINLFFSTVVLIIGVAVGCARGVFFVTFISILFSSLIAYFGFSSSKRRTDWVTEEIDIISLSINKNT